jgi:pentatricopeptide repeat protein
MLRPQEVYKIMDSSLEGFFFKRPYDLKNFNFLLQVLSEQKNYDKAIAALEKMKVWILFVNIFDISPFSKN